MKMKIYTKKNEKKLSIYSQKPSEGKCTKIGGANAPPTASTKPRKCGFCHVFTAMVWPGGHTREAQVAALTFWLYLHLDFQFRS